MSDQEKQNSTAEPYPSQEAMEAAVSIELMVACGGYATVAYGRAIQKAIEAAKAGRITEAEMAAGDLHSAATCGLSTLTGLGTPEGGRIHFIRGMLAKHCKYGIKADLAQQPS